LTENWMLIYGLLFMFVIVFLPEGILSFFKKGQEKGDFLGFKK